jgi:hypothetical protein
MNHLYLAQAEPTPPQTSIDYKQPHFDLQQIQGGQQIEILNNLWASVNLREENEPLPLAPAPL